VHRRPGATSGRKAVLVAAGALLAGALGGLLGQSLWDAGRAAATSSVVVPRALPGNGGAVPTTLPQGPARDLGVVRGVYDLAGPSVAPRGSWTVFALDGPTRMARTDTAAPFGMRLDTRTLADGDYTVTIRLGIPGRISMTWSAVLRVDNGAGTARPGRPGRPRPVPTRPTTVPPTTNPTTNPPATTTRPAPTPTDTTPAGFVAEVVRLTNVQRAGNGCAALSANTTLTAVAQAHSADMAAHDYFSHDSQDGRSPFDRMQSAGYAFSAAAENIAAGQRTPASVVDGWMHSDGHRANILNCTYTEIGVGYATGGSYGTYWTQDFGRPR
jgi:uncharacterized protein YkwD